MPNDCIKIKSTNLEKKEMRDRNEREEVKSYRNVKQKQKRTTINTRRSVLTDNGGIEKDGITFCGPTASLDGAKIPQTSKGTSSLKLAQEENKVNFRSRNLPIGTCVDDKGVTHCGALSSSDSGVSETGSEVEKQKRMPSRKNTCCKLQRLDSQPNENLPTKIKNHAPIKASTPMVLMAYVSTPTSAIKGIRKRRLNFDEEEETEKLPRRRTKVVEVPEKKETKNTNKLNKTIR